MLFSLTSGIDSSSKTITPSGHPDHPINGDKVYMGSLVKAGATGIATYQGSDNPWAEMGAEVESGAFLNFNGNTGELTFGADDNVIPDGSTVVADMLGVARGWEIGRAHV
jgi:hypothetical protein